MNCVPVIAIFDIGKTNKKFFLLNEKYIIVLERSMITEEIMDEDGDPCDDLVLLSQWAINTLRDVLLIKKFDIKAVNFSAYGASLVYIDKNGKVLTPLYNYLKKYPQSVQKELFKKYGGAKKISCDTASPLLGSLNSGLQLYRIKKERPALFKKIKYALHLPQYLNYLVTHKACSDITSIGCHTMLWDFQKNDYHQWVKAEGLDSKLAPIVSSERAAEILFNDKKLKVGSGLHDSSAALIPYLSVFNEPFVLISTGTWCISLNPFNNAPLTNEELDKDCLCYIEYHRKPIKASRLFAGYEHELQVKKLAEYFNKPPDYYKKIKYDPAIINTLKNKFSFDVLSGKKSAVSGIKKSVDQTGFDKLDLSAFNNYEQAYHCLMLDIIQRQYISTNLVIQQSNVTRIFVDGGFSNNSIYMHLLAIAFTGVEVYAALVAQASAMGAALAIHHEWNDFPIKADSVKLNYFSPPKAR